MALIKRLKSPYIQKEGIRGTTFPAMDFQEYYYKRNFVPVPKNPDDNFVCLYNHLMDLDEWLERYDYAINFIYSLGEVNAEVYNKLLDAVWEFDHDSPTDKTQEKMKLDQKRIIQKLPEHHRNIFLLVTVIIQNL